MHRERDVIRFMHRQAEKLMAAAKECKDPDLQGRLAKMASKWLREAEAQTETENKDQLAARQGRLWTW
jgi:hypothetical protein